MAEQLPEGQGAQKLLPVRRGGGPRPTRLCRWAQTVALLSLNLRLVDQLDAKTTETISSDYHLHSGLKHSMLQPAGAGRKHFHSAFSAASAGAGFPFCDSRHVTAEGETQ